MAKMFAFVALVPIFITVAISQRITPAPPRAVADITPIPMDSLNPRLTEFRRIDTNSDNALTFTEFLLGDRPYLEAQSRNFHSLDRNSDGRVSRDEFEAFYREQDDAHRRLRNDGFFKQLSLKASQTGTGPIVVNVSASNDTKVPKDFLKKFQGNVFDDSQNPPILFNFPAHLFGGSNNSGSKNGSSSN